MGCGCGKMEPLFAVVTLCYNDGALLPDALRSLRVQSHVGWEHVIVNNGSTDDTLGIARGWAVSRLRTRLVTFNENRPYPVALNTGVASTRAPWVVVLNADDELMPDALATMARVIREQPKVNCIVSPWQWFGARDDQYVCERFTGDARMVTAHQVPGIRAVRRDLWDALGGEDEAWPVGSDWDWAVRAVAQDLLKLHVHPVPLWRVRHFGERQGQRLSAQCDYPALRAHMATHFEVVPC